MVNFNPGFYPTRVMQSTPIDYNHGTITSARMTVTQGGAGNIKYYMSADGVNWEEVTSASLHFFSNTGTSLLWKIEASNKTVTNIKVEIFH